MTRGMTVMEVALALVLTFGLLAGLARVLAHHRGALEWAIHRLEVLEARRVGRDLVGRAVGSGGVLPDSTGRAGVPVRSFVGWSVPCPGGGWRYRGIRQPDPARDSAWIVDAGGRVHTSAVQGVGGGDCPPAGTGGMTLDLDPPRPDAVVARIFERGRFRVDDAVRYGRARGGAQPLTAHVLDPSGSGLEWSAGQVLLRLRGRRDSVGWERAWRP